MVSEKALYWAGVVVMIVGFTHALVSGRIQLPQSVSDRSVLLSERLSGEAAQYLAFVQAKLDSRGTTFANPEVAVVRAQARLACVQASLARQQAAITRVEAREVRSVAIGQVNSVVACPRVRRNVTVTVSDPVTVVDIDDTI